VPVLFSAGKKSAAKRWWLVIPRAPGQTAGRAILRRCQLTVFGSSTHWCSADALVGLRPALVCWAAPDLALWMSKLPGFSLVAMRDSDGVTVLFIQFAFGLDGLPNCPVGAWVYDLFSLLVNLI